MDHARYIFLQTRRRALALGLPFSLRPSDIVVPRVCPVLGFPLIRGDGRGRPDQLATIDRIIPARGYVHGNVRIISMRANRLKNNSSLRELEALVQYVRDALAAAS